MRVRGGSLILVAALTACTRVPIAEAPGVVTLSVHPFEAKASPAPLQEVRAGHVRALVPESWQARLLPHGRYPRRGFVASPEIKSWERGAGRVQGFEAFWVDVADMGIPSDYYYLAARGPTLGPLESNKACRPDSRRVFVDRPPDFTGERFSPGDYVAAATGTCSASGRSTRWVSVVAAPGFGPVRHVGIPTSGLYMMVAVVSGPKSNLLLKKMLSGARFGGTSIPEIVKAARGQVR